MCSDSALSTLLKRGLAAATLEIMIYWYGLGLGDTDFGTFEMTPVSTIYTSALGNFCLKHKFLICLFLQDFLSFYHVSLFILNICVFPMCMSVGGCQIPWNWI